MTKETRHMQRIAAVSIDEPTARTRAVELQHDTRSYIYTVEYDAYKEPYAFRVVRYLVGTDRVPRRAGDDGYYLYNVVTFLAARTNIVPLPREPIAHDDLHEHAREVWAA